MAIIETPRDRKIRRAFEADRRQQFGQTNDSWVWDGATACTHTCWQKLLKLWKGLTYSLNSVNTLAGMPRNAVNDRDRPRGMTIAESKRLVARTGLPYVYKANPTIAQIRTYGQRGPVLYGVRYGSVPEKRGFVYRGQRADGRPNGFARVNGKTQLSGAEGIRHACLYLADRRIETSAGAYVRTEILRFEPNHGSPSRPERPPYDVISLAQLEREYRDYPGERFAFVPTRYVPV